MISFLIMAFSFFLENSWSIIFFENDSFFLSCFVLVTIFIIYPLFNGNDKKYYISSFIYGLIYDIVLTNTLYLNAFIFLLFAYFISKIYKQFSINLFNSIMITIGLIVVYRFINYIIFLISGSGNFNYISLLASIYSSLIINVLYILILRFVVNLICKKTGLKKVKF